MRSIALGISILAAATVRAQQITIDNFEPGELVRYPVVMLRGHATGDSIAVGRDWPNAHRFPILHGAFRAIVELAPGTNMVVLNTGPNSMKFRIDYRPPTTDHKVLAVWVHASDESNGDEAAISAKFDAALKLIQCFYAEAMHEACYPRETFALELDDKGKVVVHFVAAPKTGNELRAMENNASWGYLYGVLSKQFPEATTHWCTLLGFTRYDTVTHKAAGHYALGGGSLGAFGNASMVYWPNSPVDAARVFADASPVNPNVSIDDSNSRHTIWANAATTLGAMAHEMGHTFTLPHSHDPFSVMSRGFDFFNRTFTVDEPPRSTAIGPTEVKPGEYSRWDPFEAARLNWNPFFQPDRPAPSHGPDPTITIKDSDVTISAPAGIRVWGVDRDESTAWFVEHKGSDPPKQATASLQELRARLMTGERFRITVVDNDGRSLTVDSPS